MGASRDFVRANSDYIALANGSGIANAFTFSAWVNPSSFTAAGSVMQWRPSSGDANEIRFRVLATQVINALIIDSSGSGGATYKDYNGATTLSANTWYHLAITWDGTNLELYVNGAQDTPYTKTTDGSVTMTDTTRTRAIGAVNLASPSNFIDAKIRDCRVYDVALTAAQVKELASGNLTNIVGNLVIWNPLDDLGAAPTYRDLTGNGNTGTDNGPDESFDGPPVFYG